MHVRLIWKLLDRSLKENSKKGIMNLTLEESLYDNSNIQKNKNYFLAALSDTFLGLKFERIFLSMHEP